MTAQATSSLLGAGGGVLGFVGGLAQNRANAKEAAKNRAFQLYMSNTAIRRRMDDMRRGGINPVLAARWDASTPAGAMATMQNVGKAAVEGASLATTTGRQIAMVNQELKNLEATEENTREGTGLLRSQRFLVEAQKRLTGYRADLMEGAAFIAQTLVGLKGDLTADQASAWVRREGMKLWQQYGGDVKAGAKWVGDLLKYIQSMLPDVVPAEEFTDRDKESVLDARVEKGYQDYVNRMARQGRKPVSKAEFKEMIRTKR